MENLDIKNSTKYLADCLAISIVNKLIEKNFKLGNNELDFISDEIKWCLILKLYQAAITLTNHYLEKGLKLMLIYHTSERKKITNLNDTKTWYSASDSFNDKNLNYTIDKCCTLGLISSKQKKQLHEFREVLRNGFSHSDMSKLFGRKQVPIAFGNLDGSQEIEHGEVIVSKFPFLQGIAQKQVAEDNALEYLNFIYNIFIQNKEILK
jgi:hypothetical protein